MSGGHALIESGMSARLPKASKHCSGIAACFGEIPIEREKTRPYYLQLSGAQLMTAQLHGGNGGLIALECRNNKQAALLFAFVLFYLFIFLTPPSVSVGTECTQ